MSSVPISTTVLVLSHSLISVITMRSLLWTTVFVFLMAELALTLILVIPVPRKIRNWICLKVSKIELKKRLKMPLMGIFCALLFALLDTINFLSQIYKREDRERESDNNNSGIIGNTIDRHLIKEKEYKAGRNLYLVGFALTLLFVIGRITELMQEHAELEGRIENLKLAATMKAKQESEERATAPIQDEDSPSEGIEMKPMQLKKKD